MTKLQKMIQAVNEQIAIKAELGFTLHKIEELHPLDAELSFHYPNKSGKLFKVVYLQRYSKDRIFTQDSDVQIQD